MTGVRNELRLLHTCVLEGTEHSVEGHRQLRHLIVAHNLNRAQIISLGDVIRGPLEAGDRLHTGLRHHHARKNRQQHAERHDHEQGGTNGSNKLFGRPQILRHHHRGPTIMGPGQDALATDRADGGFRSVTVALEIAANRQRITIRKGFRRWGDRDPSVWIVELERRDLLVNVVNKARVLGLTDQHVRLLSHVLVDAGGHRHCYQPVGHQRHDRHGNGHDDTSNERKAPSQWRP